MDNKNKWVRYKGCLRGIDVIEKYKVENGFVGVWGLVGVGGLGII